jgi:2-C-methyl-D-erythritol 4-phosphate cytidylyltransferase
MEHKNTQTSVILLAGGTGTRMQAEIPKQFLPLANKPIAIYSFELFLSMPEIDEIVVVCDPSYRYYFQNPASTKTVSFALPGERRQDSVYNGMMAANPNYGLVCVHDSARPFIDRSLVLRALEAGRTHGAATVGMPIKFTVKETDQNQFVKTTPDRSKIWEIQTPQVVKRKILEEGFCHAQVHKITVTDDVSLAELVGTTVKLVEGSHINLKITVPSDLAIANHLIQ